MRLKKLCLLLLLPTLLGAQENGDEGQKFGLFRFIKGKVYRSNEKERNLLVKKGDRFFEGDRLRTGIGSLAVLQLLDGSSLKLAANSSLKVEELIQSRNKGSEQKGSSKIVLGVGGVMVDVIKNVVGPPTMTVKTKTASFGVRGTTFYTSLDKLTGNIWTFVKEGEVEAMLEEKDDSESIPQGKGLVVLKGKRLTSPKTYSWASKLNWSDDPTTPTQDGDSSTLRQKMNNELTESLGEISRRKKKPYKERLKREIEKAKSEGWKKARLSAKAKKKMQQLQEEGLTEAMDDSSSDTSEGPSEDKGDSSKKSTKTQAVSNAVAVSQTQGQTLPPPGSLIPAKVKGKLRKKLIKFIKKERKKGVSDSIILGKILKTIETYENMANGTKGSKGSYSSGTVGGYGEGAKTGGAKAGGTKAEGYKAGAYVGGTSGGAKTGGAKAAGTKAAEAKSPPGDQPTAAQMAEATSKANAKCASIKNGTSFKCFVRLNCGPKELDSFKVKVGTSNVYMHACVKTN